MEKLLLLAETVAAKLIERHETVAVAEGSAGGLISAALLSVPGASAYFLGGGVIYTASARSGLLGLGSPDMAGIRPASEAYALLLARRTREKLGATWAIAEAGAAGPTGNRYGDPAGHCCFGVVGQNERSFTLRTGSADRRGNMEAFAARALELFAEALGEAK